MPIDLTACKRIGGAAVILTGILLLSNYVWTPKIVGETNLEVFFRPTIHIPFTRGAWQSANDVQRYALANDLVRTGLLVGGSENLALDFLGPPAIRERREDLVILYYTLVKQTELPAKSCLFPGRLASIETWGLKVDVYKGRVKDTTIVVL
jgi:hypothetical protein